ncbi:ornithine cyclodeaminase [Paenibacillus sp. DMB20]|uniref:ornithine cyclodeaminase n=1 Tax=Paenibacillus sp. DMB20 TaxID=1642570 RepID=UPI000627E3AD|nr:ornithine cyclodeaminase [Paenibacillus sp. DMB20]KKO52945.1 ornithine cyclodeaminase [Paenibacillus sp. DMB20]KKO53575.1 ornithine cyclodeaminase [Paenibacillus sp. DMB20]
MLYLNDSHIQELGIDWQVLIGIIKDVIRVEDAGDCVFPLKPYLRFGDPGNRIIAMPAYVGGSFDLAGIKWIASFPQNHLHGLPRAHNTVILNDTETGEPLAFLNSGMLSGLRTAAVSGVMLQAYVEARQPPGLKMGIIGWGPIGRLHLDMCAAVLGGKLEQVILHDLRGIDPETVPAELRDITVITDDWRTAYRQADVIATCTVSANRYIDEAPEEGKLLLGVSLRDYIPESVAHINTIVVDDWNEVCRENTDVEQLHLRYGLQSSDVRTLADVVCRGALFRREAAGTVYFNPMGLAIFDIGIAGHYWRKAVKLGKGVKLP